jgi:hypothetical protein
VARKGLRQAFPWAIVIDEVPLPPTVGDDHQIRLKGSNQIMGSPRLRLGKTSTLPAIAGWEITVEIHPTTIRSIPCVTTIRVHVLDDVKGDLAG